MYGPLCKKKILIHTIPEEAQTLELLVEDVKSTILHILNKIKETMDKELKKIRKMKYENNEKSINR